MIPALKLGIGLLVSKFVNKSKAVKQRIPEKFKKPKIIIPIVLVLVAASHAEEIAEQLPAEYQEMFLTGMQIMEGAVNLFIAYIAG